MDSVAIRRGVSPILVGTQATQICPKRRLLASLRTIEKPVLPLICRLTEGEGSRQQDCRGSNKESMHRILP